MISLLLLFLITSDTQGNPSHIHAVLRTKIDISTEAGLYAVMSKIRGCLSDLLHDDEVIDLQNKGLISSAEHLASILQNALAFLSHNCHERCQIPTIDENGGTYYICKVPDNFFRSDRPQMHTIQQLPIFHSRNTIEILQQLGMAKVSQIGFDEFTEIIDPALKMEPHIPVSSPHTPKFSPTNGHLFVAYPSSQNLQLCTGHSICSYLVRYISNIDEVALLAIKPQHEYDIGFARGEYTSLHNTKIAGNKLKALKTKKRMGVTARVLTQMEALTVVEGSDLVSTTVQFIHLPTSPREYRPAVFTKHIKSSQNRVRDEIAILAVTGQTARCLHIRNFQPYWLFTDDQMVVIKD